MIILGLVLNASYGFGQNTVFDRIAADPDLQEFEEAIIRAGLQNTFRTLSPLTVFAPTNAGFPTIPASYSQEQVADIVLTHCVNGFYRTPDLFTGFSISTMNTRNLTVFRNGNTIRINNVPVLESDILATNGVLFVINSYIPKSTTTATTIMSIIENSTKHSLLEIVLTNARLDERFREPGNYTMFAPSDEAFQALDQSRLDRLLGTNVNYIENVIMYHVVNELIEQGDFESGENLMAANGQELEITININGTFVNNVKVGFAGLPATNGIVYVINKVLFPQSLPDLTIADIIDQSDDHATLSDLITTSGIRSTLAGNGTMTFFAPTDQAFAALDGEFVDQLLNDPEGELLNILENHLLNGKHYIEDLLDDEERMTVNGYELIFDREGVDILVNDAIITIRDIEADNGLVHVIDAVLYDQVFNFTVADILALNETLSSFNNYVTQAGLVPALRTEGPYTVFAPSNAALVSLPTEIKDALDSGSMAAILDFVRNHVVEDLFESPRLINGTSITASNGFVIEITIDEDDNIFLNDSRIELINLQADNGVVHIIDAALYTEDAPNTIYEYISRNENHSILTNAVNKAGLNFLYDGAGPLTLFAPTNQAFANLPDGLLDDLFSGDVSELVDLILSHTLNDSLNIDTLITLGSVENANLTDLSILKNGNDVFINDARVVVSDINLDNGVVHVIDLVILNADNKNTVLDIVRDSDDHDNILDAIIIAEMESRYELESDISLFAPTDFAINMLAPGEWSALLADPQGGLTDFLNFHTLLDSLTTAELTDGLEVIMSDGTPAYISIEGSDIFINNAEIIIEDLIADNGVVHVIDAVLEEVEQRNTVYDVIANDDKYSILQDALVATGLDQRLINESTITYFAPTDLAFNAIPQSEFLELLSDPQGELKDILEYHLFDHNLSSNGMFDGLQIVMSNGEPALITDPGDGFYINDSKISEFDIFADNGIVHSVNAIITPLEQTMTVYDIIAAEEEITTFRSAVDAAGLDQYFEQADLVTVFAPSDNAFNALPAGVLDALLSDPNGMLTEIINLHHANGLFLSNLLSDGQQLTMVNGETVEITINNDGVFINNARVEIADLEADNGVVHVLDAVIMTDVEERFTVYDIIAESDDHGTLETALLAAQLNDDLVDGEDLTVFAPTDRAFDFLPAGVLDDLLADPTGALAAVLLNHVHDGVIGFSDLFEGNSFTMLGGLEAVVNVRSDGLYVNDAKLEVVGIMADNGVVHVIDAVLQETQERNSVYDIVSSSNAHFILKETVDAAGLADNLINDQDITLFAPTDAAFNAIPPGQFMALLDDPDGALRELLLNHTTGSTYQESDLVDGLKFDMLGGLEVTIFNSNGIFVNEALITTSDIQADNGIVHIVDAVIMPIISSDNEVYLSQDQLYPNPSVDRIFIDNKSGLDDPSLGVKIYNLNGQLMLNSNYSVLREGLDISQLDAGVYLLNISGIKGFSRFIKL